LQGIVSAATWWLATILQSIILLLHTCGHSSMMSQFCLAVETTK
jgi:hypothetical protein